MKRRSGEAMAALGRRAPVMRHRLAGRGGARNEQADLMEQALDEHGLDQPYQDSATLVEACPPGCDHMGDYCSIPPVQYKTCDCEECRRILDGAYDDDYDW